MSPELLKAWDNLNRRAAAAPLVQAAALSEAMRLLEEARVEFDKLFISEARASMARD